MAGINAYKQIKTEKEAAMSIMKKRGTIFISMVFVLTAVLLVVGGCGPKAPAGTEIRIGVMGGQTGPASSSVVPMFEELEHVFQYWNEQKGGIDGVNLSWRVIDNKGTPEGAIAAYKEMEAGFDPLIHVAVEDYYYIGIKDLIEADQSVLLTTSAINPQAYIPPGRYFSVTMPTSDGFAGYVKWVMENWKGSGKPNIGVMYWGDLPTGQQWQMAQPWVMKQGVDLTPVQFSIATMDLKPQLLSLKEANVDYIWVHGLNHNAAVAIRDYYGLGMAGTPMSFMEYVEPKALLEMAGEGAAGFYAYRSESPYSEGSDAAKLFSDIWKWADGSDKWSDNRITLTVMSTIEAAVMKAADDVGWDNLDSEAVYQALNSLTEIDTMGNTYNFGFGPSRRVGNTSMKMIQFTADGTIASSDIIVLPRTFVGIDK
jgi:ABC-type branched-subunit amino acid transport system substrate-binding protein